ncbi:MAG: hypothetical protein P8L85_10510 [Rubripirellula sp.]|nr:hypothetical protein [Rubripirellula sp.]
MNEFRLYLYGPSQGAIETSFEEAQARLSSLPRLYFEPDGSFVWALDEGRQQVFGMLYDAAGKIQYAELQGRCDLNVWQQLIDAIRGGKSSDCQILRLPEQHLQNLQSFESEHWPAGSEDSGQIAEQKK